jgi:dolichyl-phosphate beta-glucosyltransferase
VAELSELFAGSGLTWEVIVIDDGGRDFAPQAWSDLDHVTLLRFERNRGKGAAVRAGMLAARGRVRIFTDVDLPYDPRLFLVMREFIDERGFHVVIGDRTLPGSSYGLEVGWRRHLASDVYSFIVGRFITGGFFDTQCGLKGFRGDVADALFARTQLDRFAFDVELIYVSLVHRLDIKRMPVQLRRNVTSSVRLLVDSTTMLLDTLRIKKHQLRGRYESRELEAIVAGDFARVRDSIG